LPCQQICMHKAISIVFPSCSCWRLSYALCLACQYSVVEKLQRLELTDVFSRSILISDSVRVLLLLLLLLHHNLPSSYSWIHLSFYFCLFFDVTIHAPHPQMNQPGGRHGLLFSRCISAPFDCFLISFHWSCPFLTSVVISY